MYKIGECFNTGEVILEITEAYTHPQGEQMYRVEYINKNLGYIKEKGFISESILKTLPAFPF